MLLSIVRQAVQLVCDSRPYINHWSAHPSVHPSIHPSLPFILTFPDELRGTCDRIRSLPPSYGSLSMPLLFLLPQLVPLASSSLGRVHGHAHSRLWTMDGWTVWAAPHRTPVWRQLGFGEMNSGTCTFP